MIGPNSTPYQIPAPNTVEYSFYSAPGNADNSHYSVPQAISTSVELRNSVTSIDIFPEHKGNNIRRRSTEDISKKYPKSMTDNFVIEVPVPDRLLQKCKYLDAKEFTHLRYTACTTDPDDFSNENYSLRQRESNRVTEIFIVVTMYNEDDELFCKSLHALMKNIAYLCSRKKSSTWGDKGWTKAVICIVSDGISLT